MNHSSCLTRLAPPARLRSLTAAPARWLRSRDGVSFALASLLVLAVKSGLLAQVPW